ncbi:hypothetical protein Glove_161g53 [Diversispora epigaea]|uniref:Uncharacterized protein n=1 Tax=Diversispora epigaea TaxID=1348612 RepID=A0A397IW14_9GLOM|nr:hypothetical protein Glove_161g53 [Diversispora epigaea]
MHERNTTAVNERKSMTDANEATRCEFISSILHASIAITRRLTNKEINRELQRDVSGEEASGCLQNIKQLKSSFHMNKKKLTADEAFKRLSIWDCVNSIAMLIIGFILGADWHFIMFTSEGIFCTSNNEYQINLTKKALKGNQENLREDIKQVISIVV